jgi:hypothetical protein
VPADVPLLQLRGERRQQWGLVAGMLLLPLLLL